MKKLIELLNHDPNNPYSEMRRCNQIKVIEYNPHKKESKVWKEVFAKLLT